MPKGVFISFVLTKLLSRNASIQQGKGECNFQAVLLSYQLLLNLIKRGQLGKKIPKGLNNRY